MNIGAMIKLALILMNFVQWITRRIDQAEWKRAGADEAMALAASQVVINVGKAADAYAKAGKMSDEELQKRLEADL